MTKFIVSAALAASVLMPTAAAAQAVPAAVIAVVDLEKVQSQCNACKNALAALRAQGTAQENREKAMVAPLQAEQKQIQTAIDALAGKEPDAALKARATAFQTKYEQAQQEAARGRTQLQRNQAYIAQQIQAKLGPIYQQVMQRRGANILLEQGATIATSNSVDVTNDVLTALNGVLPSVVTIAPAAPAQPKQQPQGR